MSLLSTRHYNRKDKKKIVSIDTIHPFVMMEMRLTVLIPTRWKENRQLSEPQFKSRRELSSDVYFHYRW